MARQAIRFCCWTAAVCLVLAAPAGAQSGATYHVVDPGPATSQTVKADVADLQRQLDELRLRLAELTSQAEQLRQTQAAAPDPPAATPASPAETQSPAPAAPVAQANPADQLLAELRVQQRRLEHEALLAAQQRQRLDAAIDRMGSEPLAYQSLREPLYTTSASSAPSASYESSRFTLVDTTPQPAVVAQPVVVTQPIVVRQPVVTTTRVVYPEVWRTPTVYVRDRYRHDHYRYPYVHRHYRHAIGCGCYSCRSYSHWSLSVGGDDVRFRIGFGHRY